MRASLSSSVRQKPTRAASLLRAAFARARLLALCVAAAHGSVAAQQPLPANPASAVEANATAIENKVAQVSGPAVNAPTDPLTILRTAKLLYIRKESAFFKPSELENELLKRPEFQRWGLLITRTELDADLIIEVGRKVFTRFVYSIIDRRTNTVVASGKLSSLGGTLSTKIAKRVIENMKRVRP
ncbi:MAG TPA: hypothetical protein VJ715_18290 [Pyrinomonadaceae bacterium]|nr:hypothetical protein [Pyrinomonadaceae bacterium]